MFLRQAFGLYVSIHASVKDATYLEDEASLLHTVSIHASVKDATFSFLQQVLGLLCFNPRVREGRDMYPETDCTHEIVSIHASVKDATSGVAGTLTPEMFQSTRP